MGKDLIARLKAKQKKLQEQGNGEGFKYILFKDGTKRIRVLPPGGDNDWALEIIFFWLGPLRGYISPATFGEPCAIMKYYEKLKKKDGGADLAKAMKPKQRFMVAAITFKDEKGKDIDTETGIKPALLIKETYQQMLDTYLDEEGGDFTDPLEGFDFKIKRTGSGQMNTKYNAIACKPSKLDKAYRKAVNVEDLVKAITPTFEESENILKEFLAGGGPEPQDEPSEKKSSGKKKKKKKKSDL